MLHVGCPLNRWWINAANFKIISSLSKHHSKQLWISERVKMFNIFFSVLLKKIQQGLCHYNHHSRSQLSFRGTAASLLEGKEICCYLTRRIPVHPRAGGYQPVETKIRRAMFSSETQIRVRYAETDQMGVVYSNFFPYFESARAEWIRMSWASPMPTWRKWGSSCPSLKYTAAPPAALYDDLLTVRVILRELPLQPQGGVLP